MSDSERVVYLEDLEATTTTEVKDDGTENKVSNAKVATTAVTETKNASDKKETPKTGTKRQITLTDMFTSSSSTQSNAKKLKLDKAGTSSSVAVSSKKSGLQATGSLNSIPFSPSEFVASLSDDEKRLLALEIEGIGKSWLKLLKDEIRKPYFLKLKKFLWEQGVQGPNDSPNANVYPAPKNIYSWSNLTPLGRVKVVIIGQDPYHGPNQAHGLCFSVPHGVAIPPSLANIYKEIKNEYPEFNPPKHGNLTTWAQNGVLLLNTALTVKPATAGSHSGKGWEDFTDKVIDVVDKYGGANLAGNGAAGRGRGIVFMAWGAWAQKRVAKLDKKKHLILHSVHPSPLSAYRGFLGNGHFKKANEWLETKYGADGCVDWCTL
ncbi:uracil-DNA glycosylase [Phanerochaete sordida]|uniref:Uracil-DNA glycosylase n=1 Tax=Phanerochaete sordida TaxID=48140 RepID=A0A9P3GF20_9APHY|nr:uracil-DNA glycosylase [Phanerochaete sordida]